MFIEKFKTEIDPRYPHKLSSKMIDWLLDDQKELNQIIKNQKGKATANDVTFLSM